MTRIKVLLIEKESQDRELISTTLSKIDYMNFLGAVDNVEGAEYIISQGYPHVIIIGTNLDLDRHGLAKSISSEFEDIALIMIEDELKEDTMYKTLFSGAKDVIIRPFSSSKLVDSVYRASELIKTPKNIHRDSPRKEKRRKFSKGHIITVFSTKGGVGKTFVSTNLAVSLAKNKAKSVCLVDLDLDFGNTVLALNLVPRFTILDIVDDIRNIDQDVIESYLIPHESGVMVLAANAKPQVNEFVNSSHIDLILRSLKETFDYVVVDMPARFYQPVRPALQAADILLMITTPELSALKNIKTSIETLEGLNFPKSKINVVLNKVDSSLNIESKDVESTLNKGIFGTVIADYKRAMYSLNNGIPITMAKPRTPISKSFTNLAKKIDTEFMDSIRS